MPVKPGYPFADTPHPATVAPSEPEAEPELPPPGPGLAGQISALARAISPPTADSKPAQKLRDLRPGSISEQVLSCLQDTEPGEWLTTADFKILLGPPIREAHIHSAMRRLKVRGLVEERLAAPAPGKRTKREWRLAAAAAGNSSPETVDKPPEAG